MKVNQKIQERPELVNNDPYGEGWFLHIEISNQNECSNLLNQAQYQAICGSGH